MYRANNLVEEYIRYIWNREIEPLNRPVKFKLKTELNSSRRVKIEYFAFDDTLTHLFLNSMAAISKIDDDGIKIMERWKTDVPGKIILRTYDLEDITRLEVEDDGCGINPRHVRNALRKGNYSGYLKDAISEFDLINAIYERGLSAKAGSAGVGLSDSKKFVEGAGGKIHTAGTTYSKSRSVASSRKGLATIGEHHGKSTGTIIRMEFPSKP